MTWYLGIASVRRSDDKSCIVYGDMNKLHKPKHNQHKFQDCDRCCFCFFDSFGVKTKRPTHSVHDQLTVSERAKIAVPRMQSVGIMRVMF